MLETALKTAQVVEKNGIYIANEIAEKTVWDKLATENPTHAVISANNEEAAQRKSETQIEAILQHLKPTDVLLDFGSGYGRVAKYLLPKHPLAGYIAVDSAYEMLRIFKARYDASSEEMQTPVLFVNADIHTVPLREASVDVVIVSAVFLHNHKDTVKKAIAELRRVVKPGGTVLIYSSFPRGMTLMGMQGYFYQAILNLMGKPFKNGPVRYYTKKEVTTLFSEFSELDLVPVEFAVLPKTLIFLPGILERVYRLCIANPINALLEKITPQNLKPVFAMHLDVIAKR